MNTSTTTATTTNTTTPTTNDPKAWLAYLYAELDRVKVAERALRSDEYSEQLSHLREEWDQLQSAINYWEEIAYYWSVEAENG